MPEFQPGDSGEKRAAPRFYFGADMFVRSANEPSSEVNTVSLKNASVRGIYFNSPIPHAIGARLKFSIPSSHSNTRIPVLAGIASVMRCDELKIPEGGNPFGIAARIDEVIPFGETA